MNFLLKRYRSRFFGVLCLLLAVALQGNAAFALDTRAQVIEIKKTINQGDLQRAQQLLNASDLNPNLKLFFRASILKRAGQYDRAINAFREYLRHDPGSILARQELAHTLYLNKDYTSARYHFAELLRIDAKGQMRNSYAGYIRQIDAEKPFGFSGSFALLPSTNVNRGSQHLVFNTGTGQFTIDPGSRQASGIGVEAGVSGSFQTRISPTNRLIFNAGLNGRYYSALPDYNTLTGSLAANLEHKNQTQVWTFGVSASHTRKPTGKNTATTGASLSVTQKISPKLTLSLGSSYTFTKHAQSANSTGGQGALSLGISQQISTSLSLQYGLFVSQARPKGLHLQYNEQRITFGISKNWTGGIQTQIGAKLGVRSYVGDFPLVGHPRNDQYLTLNFAVLNSAINYKGFTPRLDCSHTIGKSNIALYDHKITECRIGLTREF